MKLVHQIKQSFRPPSHLEIAARDLEDAKRERLGWLARTEESRAFALALTERIERLEAYLKETHDVR